MKVRELFEEKSVVGLKVVGELVTDKTRDTVWMGDFSCRYEKLTTLIGCPKEVKGSFACNNNQIKSLKGCPEKIKDSFYCFANDLASLEDGPKFVGSHYSCSSNNITSLKGAPTSTKGAFDCSNNKLTSLEFGPSVVTGALSCPQNRIDTFEGFPSEIGNNCRIDYNKFTSLKDIHKHIKRIGGSLYASGNPIKSHILGVLLIEGCKKLVIDDIPEVVNIVNKYLPNTRGRAAIYDCQDELINAGFEEYAQL